MTELVNRSTGEFVGRPAGARQLGARVKPIIRLGMGFKDPERGFPRKTDHFTVRGDERAIAKFKHVYGDEPKAVKIMVPSELALALEISYRSFVGGESEDGGRPLALGKTNFAVFGYVGGPDVLRVWRQDGSYDEVETAGLDELGKPLDEAAAELNIEVHTTFTFTIPEVLGWGSFAQITSKGKKSADNLAFKLSEIYSAFGSKAPWAFDRDEPPMLVLKPDTALMRFEDKKGEARWGKSKIFVLDIVIPESFDDMRDRLAQRQSQLGGGAAAELYGQRAALEAGPPPAAQEGPEDGSDAAAARSEEEGSPTGAEPSSSPEPRFEAPEGAGNDDPAVLAANEAGEVEIPSGANKGRKIRELLDDKNGTSWLRWALRNWSDDDFGRACWAFAAVYAPDVHEQVADEKAKAVAE